jgi:meiotically up-regulated gene 157 (Mug157) protein
MKSILAIAACLLICQGSQAQEYKSNRPAPEKRCFSSEAVERTIAELSSKLANPKLAWMFSNCFPNTIDTTVEYDEQAGDTFVITGDIHAMWLRDSGAQVWPYLRLAGEDEHLRKMLAGVLMRQFRCIAIDPYANAFNKGPSGSKWESDITQMNPWLHERKWEVDSPCYVLRLAHGYWKATGDTSVFGDEWLEAVRAILRTFREQQRYEGQGPYSFMRRTPRGKDTKSWGGFGAPVKPCGLICSSFRPSDDASVLEFLIPSNFFAVSTLRKAAEILEGPCKQGKLARECRTLADEVAGALEEYAVVEHPKYGKIYAYEVDGFGSAILMDDANVPSLLAMPYLGCVSANDPVWQNTRRFVLSTDNPCYFEGTALKGVGGPHVGLGWVWPMSIIMQAFTSSDDAEIRDCIRTLISTDAGTGFMHEAVWKDDPAKFTRSWFAWANTLFGELILDLYQNGKLELLGTI